ncbi:MAG: restriction endonuclease subunit S, partial [Muribaculaceae bacterium]|nr:restriction endonuclease subunit S [Muribaculaceae bacterium]
LDLDILSRIRKPYALKDIPAGNLFVIKSATPSYDKLDLMPIEAGQDSYDYITRTSENHGICDVTSFISNNGKQEAGTFSLGLMQMIFFLRKREWYAGQFVKVVSCKDDVSYNAKIYLQTILNGLTTKLLSVLVRDVEKTFKATNLRLPVKENGNVDYDWMEEYVNMGRYMIINELKNSGLLI